MKRILSIVITAILAGAFAFTGLAPASASPRTGALHITKECSDFQGQAGQFCTITSSNLRAIPVGSRVFYLKAADFTIGQLDSDIVLYTGPGNSALGHVFLNLLTGTGTVTLNGGTGKFENFHARVTVSFIGDTTHPYDWGWEGTYSFSSDD
jgi:hypothetical protein